MDFTYIPTPKFLYTCVVVSVWMKAGQNPRAILTSESVNNAVQPNRSYTRLIGFDLTFIHT